ncbi:beta-N-acetylglucosaminidase domain-containing protein [Pseudoflavonifractor sp. An85]|uniref:beta-N-acetylglucosaminidase domain-containing protein n=1 Tax=Pseudoflavonifractor sp. An85 TaxID=1965661 RepID=UPI000B3AF507|nr:beta-N-acetylglucosaminidase domain-containing protein [Pseudoflavonifractor sp. An85]OUN24350.1 hypothetical protein B5G37_07780 [Pseudoflavonifractor sp. An85]
MRRQNKSAQPKHTGRRVTAAALAVLMGAGCVRLAPLQAKAQDAEATGYEIYPNPHVMTYSGDTYMVKNQVNVVLEEGIDRYTKDRLEEVLKLKDISYTTSEAVVSGKTNILVGIEGSNGYVDTYAEKNVAVETQDLYNKLDSYVLDNDNGVITVVGKDTDAAFYGLTTLYHVFAQMDSFTIQEFHVEDWADVASRGFIEGYYGNPWSTEDRQNLMTWGGYYKLNSYFYAPKDDPKHNANWRELYTEEEIQNKIIPLAEAGNASKCRFVYALHPFMYNAVRFNNDENYQADLKAVQAKFAQVIEAGVRQIAILADDAAHVGNNNYIKFLTDMSNWLKEMQKTYPDLKMTLPFCTQEYMYGGESYYAQFPENVQIVMTGGKVWGEVTDNFTSSFTNKVGRGPYMWINWPCTDNSKKHLIMGGYTTFLHPGVNPANIQGIVLNPMQQSEPSKVAIFGNACYSWNIWKTEEEANQAWYDSFKYVDHNSAMETDASAALRELSKHMINQAMDNRVTVLQESVELKQILNPFKDKLAAGNVTAADVDVVMAEFVKLQEAAKTYRAKAGNTDVKDQIVYWLNCWDDTTEAAIAYLNGVKAVIANDATNIIQYNTQGKTAFDRSKTYEFWYVDHNERAEVGVQHIVPFIKTLASYVSQYAETAMDPNKVIPTFVTNRVDTPSGDVSNVFDGNDATYASYRDPNTAKAGDYVGVMYNKVIPVENIRFLLGGGKNHFDASKLQYTEDGKEWKDISLTGMGNAFTGELNKSLEVVVEKEHLPQNFQAMGIRLIATRDNAKDLWLDVHEIQINKEESQEPELIGGTFSTSDGLAVKGGNLNNLKDGNNGTEVWLSNAGDKTVAGAYIQYTFQEATAIGTVYFGQGSSASGDVIQNGKVQYQSEDGQWHDAGNVTSAQEQTFDFNGQGVVAKAVRIYNNTEVPVWWRVGEFRVMEVKQSTNSMENVYTNVDNAGVYSNQENGKVTLSSATLTLNKDQYMGVDLGSIKAVTQVLTTKLPENVTLETSRNGITWTAYNAESDTDARYVRAVSSTNGVKLDLTQFEVSYKYVSEKAVESNFAKGSNDRDVRVLGNVGNVFDGDLATFAEITGPQDQGKHITFDLGQVIHFDSLRYYIKETHQDYLRHALFEVSVDGETWTPVMTVGKQVENVNDSTVAKDAPYLTHDSSNPGYMYADAGQLNVDGRYIRITPQSTYSHKWVYISELMINGGAYISPEANRDIVSNVVEEQGKLPSYALDGDYSTTYKPGEANSSFTYYISSPQDLKTLRMVQLGAVSNATVTANFVGEDKAVTLGNLSQAINEFVLPQGKTLESVTVTWKETIPEIAEIATSTASVEQANKTALKEALEAKQPTDTWTTDSVKAYEEAKKVAQEAYDNVYASQSVVDSALGSLQSAVANAVPKATNVDELQKLVDEMIRNDQHIYTTVSYYTYSAAVENLKAALANADNLSQADANRLKATVEEARKALVYSTYNQEVAQMTVESYAALKAENYSQSTFQAVTAAKQAIETLLAKSDATPMELIQAVADYQAAVAALADITALKSEIDKAEKVNDELYTAESYQAYMDAVQAGKALLETGTKEQVEQAVADIRAKFAAMDLNPDTPLGAVVAEAEALNGEHYTTDSYNALMALVAEAKANPTDESYVQKMVDAMKALVNVEALKAQLAAAQTVDAEKYTTSSYKTLSNLMGQVDALLQSGTQQKVDQMTAQMDMAIRSLVVRATGVEEYRNSIKLEAADGYTAESYKVYKNAYDALMAADPADLSASEFAQLKANFEKAKLSLKHVEANKPEDNDDVHTGDTFNLVPYVLAVAVSAAGLGALVMVKSKKRG